MDSKNQGNSLGPGFWRAGLRILGSWLSNRQLAKALIRREIQTRYRGSVLGMLWSILSPLVLLLTYTLVFSVFFHNKWGEGLDWPGSFTVMLFCGMIPFNFFSDVISRSPTLIIGSPNYVKRVSFPVELLPIVSTAAALFNAAISTCLLLVAILLLKGSWPVTLPAMALIWMPLIVFTVAVSLVLAAASVFLRDLQHTVGLLLNVLFFLTPVFYPETLIPVKLRFLLYINPMAYVAVHSRRIAALGIWPNMPNLAVFTALCLLLLWIAAAWFASVRRRFADVL
jgi:lipopolysaccharide transport system permease protein